MQKLFAFFLFLNISYYPHAQHYHPPGILKKADSIMISFFGERIFREYYHYDTNSFYTYVNLWGKNKQRPLLNKKRTRGKFKGTKIRYSFCLNKFNLYCMPSDLFFDSSLTILAIVDTSFVPGYAKKNITCNFINDTTALKIARTKFSAQVIKAVKIEFEFSFIRNRYYWHLVNMLSESDYRWGPRHYRFQTMEIDAESGEIISFSPEVYKMYEKLSD